MVCKKMYGGGMGDQIKRYCDEMDADVIILINAFMIKVYLIDYSIFSCFDLNNCSRLAFYFTGLSEIKRNRET